MEAAWINAFCTTTMSVLKTMFSLDAKPGTPMLKHPHQPSADISAIIGFSGEAQGAIAMSFPSATALKIVSAMLGTPMTKLDADVSDAIGEIVNIVAGNVKTAIPELKLFISLPQVVIGEGHSLSGQTSIPTIVVPFTTPMGDFAIEVSLKKK